MALRIPAIIAALVSTIVILAPVSIPRALAANASSSVVWLEVQSISCPVFTFSRRRWLRVSPSQVTRLFSVGQQIRARKVPSRGDIVLIKRSGRVYAVGRSCFTAEEKPAVVASSHPPGHFYAEFGVYQWQETLTVLSSIGPPSTLISNDSWVCPGMGYRRSFARNLEWDVNGCVVYGQSDASLASTNAETLIGAEASGNVLWSPTGGTTQLGFGIPILIRHGSWNNSAGTSAIEEVTVLFAGLQVESNFYLGNFALNPKLGYFPGSTSVLWSLNLNYTF